MNTPTLLEKLNAKETPSRLAELSAAMVENMLREASEAGHWVDVTPWASMRDAARKLARLELVLEWNQNGRDKATGVNLAMKKDAEDLVREIIADFVTMDGVLKDSIARFASK